jgi:hypothetical protein
MGSGGTPQYSAHGSNSAPGDAGIQRGKMQAVPLGQQEEVSVRGPCRRGAPNRPFRPGKIIRKKWVNTSERFQHAPKHFRCVTH